MVDEQVSVTAVGPMQSVVTYDTHDGQYSVKDAKGTSSGTGTYQASADGGWSSWTSELSFSGGYTAEATGSQEGTGFAMHFVVKGPDGAVAQTMDQHYTALDPAACDAAWAKAMASKAPPPGAAPGKKPKGKK